MKREIRFNIHLLLRAVILFGFAMYIIYLVKSNNILYYIAPHMIAYIKWAAVGLYTVAVYQGYLAVKSLSRAVDDCDCEHHQSTSKFKNSIVYSLFLIPLLFGFLLPDSAMGSDLASKKGMNLTSSSTLKSTYSAIAVSGGTEKLEELFPSDPFTELYAKFGKQLYTSDLIRVKEDVFIETLTTLDLYKDSFIGKSLEISGFIYRDETMKENQFVVARFAIQCCSADASPYGVLVEFPQANNYSLDSWVKVSGVIGKDRLLGADIIKLKVKSIKEANPPAAPYVYINYEFGRGK